MKKEIIIQETIGVARTSEFVRTGIPFAKGELTSVESLMMLSPDGAYQPVQSSVLNRWHDGSVKWLILDFTCSIPPHAKASYYLTKQEVTPPRPVTDIHITQSETNWTVDTGPCQFVIDSKRFHPFAAVRSAGVNLLPPESPLSCILRDQHGLLLDPVVEDISQEETSGPIRTIVRLRGYFDKPGSDSIRFSCRLHFFGGTSLVQMEMCLHNPKAAHHPGGLWDLGDPGSFLLKEFALQLPLARELAGKVLCQPYQDSPLLGCASNESLSVYQESSGGEQWLSPVHRNRKGEIPLTFQGYKILQGGAKIDEGKRATPALWCGQEGKGGVAVSLPWFWQEFPKALAWEDESFKISFFPAEFPDLHELQGGEQKTFTVALNFAALSTDMAWASAPLTGRAAPQVYHHSGVIPDLPSANEGQADLVDIITGPDEFFRKRENAEEYGWRNFGEVHADHEAVYHKGDNPFVSHYNNQYDLCAGMYRKFLASGDPAWGELAADLARHVRDIDIYHTNQDREEYNNGLFWHTDHYIASGLSTHRSFSRDHLEVKDPRFCGGGPGAEHCYTTGLMLHYSLTGNPDYRDAVINLAEWVLLSLSGPQTILAVIKRSIGYLKQLRRIDGNNRPLFPRYPLTRGTGNAITACLDAFEVSGDKSFLDRAEQLIRGSLHPDDDIDARDLLNAELAWSYTVLLVAVTKFLTKKRELEEYDAGYTYAKAAFLSYAEWMYRHEYLYLEKPEILEYPNETWPAQDLRKSVIFYYASRYAEETLSERYMEKARYFFTAAWAELFRQPTSRFTRPVALVLQNEWVKCQFGKEQTPIPACNVDETITGKAVPTFSLLSVISRMASDIISVLPKTSIKRELAWLKARI